MPSYTTTTTLRSVSYDAASDPIVAHSYFDVRLINDDDPDDVILKTIPADFILTPELAAQIERLATDARDLILANREVTRVAKAEARAVEMAAALKATAETVVDAGPSLAEGIS